MARGGQSAGFIKAVGAPAWATAQNLILSDSGTAKPILYNTAVALSQDPAFLDAIRFDAFRGRTMVCAPLPWDPAPQVPRPWRDQDDRETCAWLQDKGILCTDRVAHLTVQMVAERDQYHPVMDYLSGVSWDGIDRLDRWLITYVGAPDNVYIEAVGARWLMSGVARVFEPGCKVDCALILEGPQGILKSTVFAVIGGKFYTDDIAAIGTKDAQEQILGKHIIEIAELDAITRAKDVSAVKAFMSRGTDDFRLPYDTRSHPHPRQCIFGATTNRDTWQRDDTGSRRFWPVKCGKIDIDQLRVDRDQLWAEARDRYMTGERWWLHEPHLIAMQQAEAEDRFDPDPWYEAVVRAAQDHISAYYRPEDRNVSVDQIFKILLIPIERRDRIAQARVAQILKHAGWQRQRDFTNGVEKIIYSAP